MKSTALILCALLLLGAGILFGLSMKNFQKTESEVTVNPAVHTVNYEPEDLQQNELATIALFKQSVPSVAFITTSTLERNYWNRNITEIPRGSGSGFIWDEAGHVVTNFHVIQGADKATVTLHDQNTYEAIPVGIAPDKDLAVLKIVAPDVQLKALLKGESASLQVGQTTLAIGNPFGLDYSLTTGIISALGREINSVNDIKITDVIQTDAAINPGNSGGPLLNSKGELIGVNTAIYSPSGAYAGIGFSIPVDEVKWVVSDLIKYGKIRRPILGIELLPGTMAQDRYGLEGALIMNVTANKGAALAGLQGTKRDRRGRIFMGDLIVSIDGKAVKNNSDLVLRLEDYNPGDKVVVEFMRNDRKESTEVILSEN